MKCFKFIMILITMLLPCSFLNVVTAKADTVTEYQSGVNLCPSPVTLMPSIGNANVVVLPVDFVEEPHIDIDTISSIQSNLFGQQNPSSSKYPYESITAYYQRSSYGKLNIDGKVLSWYRAKHSRQYYLDLGAAGFDIFATEVLEYYKSLGVDFSKYDGNNDGVVDAFYIMFTGPKSGFATTFYPQVRYLNDKDYSINGMKFGKYTLVDYSSDNIKTYIHETGHLMGLPDLYDLKVSFNGGGGIGKLGMMGSTECDQDVFSKILLGWITPKVIKQGDSINTYNLRPYEQYPDALVITPSGTWVPYSEYFVVANITGTLNNSSKEISIGTYSPSDFKGIAIWHVNSTVENQRFIYSNTGTGQKFQSLVEADGLNNILKFVQPADPSDLFNSTKVFSPNSIPESCLNNDRFTGINVSQIHIYSDYATVSAGFQLDCDPPKIVSHFFFDTFDGSIRKGNINITFNTNIHLLSILNKIKIFNNKNEEMNVETSISKNIMSLKFSDDSTGIRNYHIMIPTNYVSDTIGNGIPGLEFTLNEGYPAPSVQWNQSYGNNNRGEQVKGLVSVQDGYIAIGLYGAYEGIYIVKTDFQGNTIWKKEYPSTEGQISELKLIKINDNLFCAYGWNYGWDYSSGGYSHVITFDNQGTKLIDKSDKDYSGRLLIYLNYDNDGVIRGFFRDGNMVIFDKNLNVISTNNICDGYKVVKYILLPDGKIAVLCNKDEYISENLSTSYMVRILDKNMNKILEKHWNQEKSLEGMDMLFTNDNSLIINGHNKDNGIFISKIDLQGNLIWEKKFEDNFSGNSNFVSKLSQDTKNIYMEYNFLNTNLNKTSIKLLKLDSKGNIVWKGTYINSGNIGISDSYKLLSDGSGILATTTYENVDGGDIHLYKLSLDTSSSESTCVITAADDLSSMVPLKDGVSPIFTIGKIDISNDNKIIIFNDGNFKKAMLEAGVDLNKDGEISIYEMESISGTLDLESKDISDLSGLQYATGIKSLNLNANKINDINPIKDLKFLENLDLSNNNLIDIDNLCNIISLSNLNLYNNQISDISSLSYLNNLQVLNIRSNKVSNINALKFLVNLNSLDIRSNQITDISVLLYLKGISILQISENPISDISVLSNLSRLTDLSISGIKANDISCLASLSKLNSLDASNNSINNYDVLTKIGSLQMLLLNNDNIYDIKFLSSLANIDWLQLYENQITDITPILNYTKLLFLDLTSNCLDITNGSITSTFISKLKQNGTCVFYDKQVLLYDINKDGKVNLADLAIISKKYNTKSMTQNWDKAIDLNNDGIIDVFDLVVCSKKMTK